MIMKSPFNVISLIKEKMTLIKFVQPLKGESIIIGLRQLIILLFTTIVVISDFKISIIL